MKILFTIYNLKNVGGAEASTYFLAKGLKNIGHEVIIASTGKYPKIKTYVFKKYRKIPSFSLQKHYLSNFLSKIITKEKIDIVHAQDRLTTVGAITAAKDNKIPVVVHFRDYWFVCPKSTCLMPSYKECSVCSLRKIIKCVPKKRLLWEIYKLYLIKSSWNLLKKANVKIAISNVIKNKLKLIGITKSIKVISNPIDLDLFIKANRKKIRKKYNLNGVVITFIGSIAYYKGVSILMKLIPKILKEKRNVYFLIVGDGPLKNQFVDFIKSKNLKNVIFTGKIPYKQVPNIYAASDILLFPSILQEPFGRIAIEAMAASKPIIASNVGGIKDIINHGKTGYLVDPFDLKKWKEYLHYLINNEKLRKKMGEKGYKLAKKKYDTNIIAKKIFNIYKKL